MTCNHYDDDLGDDLWVPVEQTGFRICVRCGLIEDPDEADAIQEQADRIQSKSRKQLIRHRAVRRARHKAA